MTSSRFHFTCHPARIRVLFQGHELADSADVIALSEAGHDPVWYFPKEDVQMSSLRANASRTTCPWKGDATWYTIMRDGHLIEDVAWSYDHPKEDAEILGDRIAFDPRHVEFQMEGAAEERVVPHVPAHDPPYADDLDPMGRREIPSRPEPRTPG
jgi:uncharacterized protein (DUF427 family)